MRSSGPVSASRREDWLLAFDQGFGVVTVPDASESARVSHTQGGLHGAADLDPVTLDVAPVAGVGAALMLGELPGVVVRHTDTGFGTRFESARD